MLFVTCQNLYIAFQSTLYNNFSYKNVVNLFCVITKFLFSFQSKIAIINKHSLFFFHIVSFLNLKNNSYSYFHYFLAIAQIFCKEQLSKKFSRFLKNSHLNNVHLTLTYLSILMYFVLISNFSMYLSDPFTKNIL